MALLKKLTAESAEDTEKKKIFAFSAFSAVKNSFILYPAAGDVDCG
jgi:hypothetical protein